LIGLASQRLAAPVAVDRLTVSAVTLRDLVASGVEDTTRGVKALQLAELIDVGGYNATGAASLHRAHEEAMVLALEAAAPLADVVDLIFAAEPG
jgi:hypothetical protein